MCKVLCSVVRLGEREECKLVGVNCKDIVSSLCEIWQGMGRVICYGLSLYVSNSTYLFRLQVDVFPGLCEQAILLLLTYSLCTIVYIWMFHLL